MLAAVLHSVQVANWQRGRGKGMKPKPLKRPKDRSPQARKHDPQTSDDLAARRRRMEDELEKRRKAVS